MPALSDPHPTHIARSSRARLSPPSSPEPRRASMGLTNVGIFARHHNVLPPSGEHCWKRPATAWRSTVHGHPRHKHKPEIALQRICTALGWSVRRRSTSERAGLDRPLARRPREPQDDAIPVPTVLPAYDTWGPDVGPASPVGNATPLQSTSTPT
ncbi:hypothetical protein WOLCODRAFT_151549 [Wolfiporia cocos MD-104 SS10]|uniref:Uncharacterized protein n=1 Tax=Wolfiporia cocos (strain MD-104) TaxID=742152 RepID=A0A2H3JH34_WOLCO|nr:hypothetical protein WOLCODRAFT_151549 [Wolfiporia cocos MD-104 SS10]